MDTKKLPQIADLYKDTDMAIKQNQLNVLLNHPPKKEWCKPHPMAPSVKYIPIERIEWLLTTVFQKWRCQVLQVQLIANSVQVTVRLYVKDPLSDDWDYNDGVGAAPLQVDKGAPASDWNKVKNNAVMLAVPAAKSYAIKDAAENFGRLFGADLNRKDTMNYGISDTLGKKALMKEVSEMLDYLQDTELKQDIMQRIKTAMENGEDDMEFYQQIKNEINGK